MRICFVIKEFAKETYLSFSEGGPVFKVFAKGTCLYRFPTKEEAESFAVANLSDLCYEIIPVYHISSSGRIQV